jgi:Transposase
MFYVGIDWADQHHDALVLDETGRQLGSIRVDHTPEGLAKLNSLLEKLIGPDKE